MFSWLADIFRRTERKSIEAYLDRYGFNRVDFPSHHGGHYATQQEGRTDATLLGNDLYTRADTVYNRQVRHQVMRRARAETRNNSYAMGLSQTLANDVIGDGPRLSVQSENLEAADELRELWNEWSHETAFANKLHTMRHVKCVDGEAFGVMGTNPNLAAPVKLDFKLFDAELFETPWELIHQSQRRLRFPPADGITYDRYGNPRTYYKMRYQPGEFGWPYATLRDYDRLASRYVAHVFNATRPQQPRGISELLPSLNLFADLRRYTEAVIANAEIAANITGVITSEMPLGQCDEITDGAFTRIAIPKGSLMNLPDGWDFKQARAEQPATMYEAFKQEVLREIARCLHIPYNVAAGDSSGYNYASGRLDWQTYYRSLEIERTYFERCVLSKVWREWFEELMLLGLVPAGLGPFKINWYWQRREHVDPLKEAQAATTLYAAGLLDEEAYWNERGRSLVDVYRQQSKARELREELGLPSPGATTNVQQTEESEDDEATTAAEG